MSRAHMIIIITHTHDRHEPTKKMGEITAPNISITITITITIPTQLGRTGVFLKTISSGFQIFTKTFFFIQPLQRNIVPVIVSQRGYVHHEYEREEMRKTRCVCVRACVRACERVRAYTLRVRDIFVRLLRYIHTRHSYNIFFNFFEMNDGIATACATFSAKVSSRCSKEKRTPPR